MAVAEEPTPQRVRVSLLPLRQRADSAPEGTAATPEKSVLESLSALGDFCCIRLLEASGWSGCCGQSAGGAHSALADTGPPPQPARDGTDTRGAAACRRAAQSWCCQGDVGAGKAHGALCTVLPSCLEEESKATETSGAECEVCRLELSVGRLWPGFGEVICLTSLCSLLPSTWCSQSPGQQSPEL